MHLDTDKLGFGVGLRHAKEAIPHPETDLHHTPARTTKAGIPIEDAVGERETEFGKPLLPAALLTGSHTPGPHDKTAHSRRQRLICGSHKVARENSGASEVFRPPLRCVISSARWLPAAGCARQKRHTPQPIRAMWPYPRPTSAAQECHGFARQGR